MPRQQTLRRRAKGVDSPLVEDAAWLRPMS